MVSERGGEGGRGGGETAPVALGQQTLTGRKHSKQVRSFTVGDLALSSVVPLPASRSLPTGAGGGGSEGQEQLVAVGSWDSRIYIVSLQYGRVVQELSCGHDDAVCVCVYTCVCVCVCACVCRCVCMSVASFRPCMLERPLLSMPRYG